MIPYRFGQWGQRFQFSSKLFIPLFLPNLSFSIPWVTSNRTFLPRFHDYCISLFSCEFPLLLCHLIVRECESGCVNFASTFHNLRLFDILHSLKLMWHEFSRIQSAVESSVEVNLRMRLDIWQERSLSSWSPGLAARNCEYARNSCSRFSAPKLNLLSLACRW